jgi:Peptidase family M1 domain
VRARDVTMVTLAAMVNTLAVLAMGATQSAPQPPPAAARDQARSTETPASTPARSPRNASYTITARLDPASRTLKGEELVTWRNTSAHPATSLRFHLYYNAWRNTRSTWMREFLLGGNDRLADRPESDWAWIDVTSLKLIGTSGAPVDVTSSMRFIAPDDGNVDDRTVMEVPLDVPVAPGETRNIQIAWSSRVPRTFARTGAIGNFYFLAQWFPKIGVLQNNGWNCHQFHATTEFFADFGIYDVRLTVPAGWVVGATGLERGRRDEGDGTTTHHYHAEDVHDFAWTTSPDYVERTARFGHQTLPPVAMRLLLQPEHVGQAERHFEATRAALKYYGEWYGPYPYPNITIVDPAWQSGADGMEYPTLFTAGTRWIAPRHVAEPEDVTVHEAGHQFWYGVVATNEFENAWMDEGLNTFSTARTLDQFFQPNYYSKRYFGSFIPWVFRDLPLTRATDGNNLSGYRPSARGDAQATQSWRYWPDSAGAITYFKTSLWLQTLERMLGWDVLQRILSTYYMRYAFKHPEPQEFFAVVNEVSRRDLSWFFDQVYRSSNVFDYGVDVFTSERVSDRGYFGDPGRQAYSAAEESGDQYRTTVVVRRFGEGIFPVDVRVVFDNKQDVRWQWDGRERWKLFEVDRPVRAVSAQVDPERVLMLDVNYTNNSKSLEPRTKAAARKWSLVWLIWLQDHLLTYGFFT